MAKAIRLILDGVRDHVVCHIVGKGTVKEMWDALATLYQGSSEPRKMYLEEKMRSTRVQKGERIDSFLSKLQEVRDSLAIVGSAHLPTEMVRLALNSVSEEWQVFVQNILGKDRLSDWEGMWAALQQEEMRRDLVKCNLIAAVAIGQSPRRRKRM